MNTPSPRSLPRTSPIRGIYLPDFSRPSPPTEGYAWSSPQVIKTPPLLTGLVCVLSGDRSSHSNCPAFTCGSCNALSLFLHCWIGIQVDIVGAIIVFQFEFTLRILSSFAVFLLGGAYPSSRRFLACAVVTNLWFARGAFRIYRSPCITFQLHNTGSVPE